MGEKKRDTTGRYSRSVDDTDVVTAVRAHDPAATSEIAGEVGISRQGADRRLRDLRDRGEVSSKKIGASLVWFMPRDRGRQTPREPQESGEPTPGLEGDQSPTDTGRATRAATEDASPDTQPFDGVEFPTGKDREQCVEAINATREYLREQGPATMREIVSTIHPDYPLGYDVDEALAKVEAGERYRGAWWRRIVKPGLEAAEDVKTPGRGQSKCRYTGGDQ